MKPLQRVLIMAGGTGGHVFPGLAVAKYLRDKGVDVHWLGTQLGLEARVVPSENIPLHFISIGGVRGKNMKTLFAAPFRIMLALTQAMRILSQLKPDVVIGLGGFVSGPGGVASWLLRYPLIIHEQNAKAGLTNQWLKKLSQKVFTGFPNVFPGQARVEVIGNPVRAEMAKLLPPAERLPQRRGGLRLLVLGGSLGAQAINEIVPRCIARLKAEGVSDIEIYHQTGIKHDAVTAAAYRQLEIDAKVVSFITEMDQAYAWADIVLCRAGALTIAELCAVGLGAILVPFPHAVDDHQTVNGEFLVDKGAAILIQQRDLTEDLLVKTIRELSQQPEKRLEMAQAAYRLRKVDVAEKIYEGCINL